MNVDELRIQNSGLAVNVIDLIIFDVIAGLLNDMRKIDCWQTVAQNDKFCRSSYAEIYGNVKHRLQGIVNSPDSLRKKVDRLIELGLFEKYPNQRILLLRPGTNYNRLKRMHDLTVSPELNTTEEDKTMQPPTEAEVEAFFKENGLTDWEGFFRYNNDPKRQWTIGWNRAPMVEWHSFARRWKNFGFGGRGKKMTPVTMAAPTVPGNMPRSLSPEKFEALSPTEKAKYKKSRLPNGSEIYIVK